jgi:hypothetical protein
MVVFQLGEETEGVAFLLTRIEEDDLITEGLVELLVLVVDSISIFPHYCN